MLTVRLADEAEIRELQLAVLRPDGPQPADRPFPAGAVHVGAFDDDGPAVGATTIVPARWPGPGELPGPTWQLRSMAVRADRRGSGVGLRVLDLAVATAFGLGAGSLWAGARLEALEFYTGAGWSVVGPEWVKPGIGPHRYVTRTRRPPGDTAG